MSYSKVAYLRVDEEENVSLETTIREKTAWELKNNTTYPKAVLDSPYPTVLIHPLGFAIAYFILTG